MQHGQGPKLHSQPSAKTHPACFLFDWPNVPFSQAVGSRVGSFGGGTPQNLLQSVVVQPFVDKSLAADTVQTKNDLAFILCLCLGNRASSLGKFNSIFSVKLAA